MELKNTKVKKKKAARAKPKKDMKREGHVFSFSFSIKFPWALMGGGRGRFLSDCSFIFYMPIYTLPGTPGAGATLDHALDT